MILSCNCKSPYQDEKYGLGKRVHNPTTTEKVFRCTICETENSKGNATVEGKGKKGKK